MYNLLLVSLWLLPQIPKEKDPTTVGSLGTNVLNEAFLERFPLTFEQEYPTVSVETKMLHNYCSELQCCDDAFITNLVNWADIIRKTFLTKVVLMK